MEQREWQLEKDRTLAIAGIADGLTQEIYGALSQDATSPLSRVSLANSSFSLDPFSGCPARCAYCTVAGAIRDVELRVESTGATRISLPTRPRRLFTGPELVAALVDHPAFIQDRSVISVATASTEAFLPGVEMETWEIMHNAAVRGLKNPFWFVVKMGIPRNLVDKWEERFAYIISQGIEVIVSVTHSGAPSWVEPYAGDRFAVWSRMKAIGVHVSHHFRPIIPGVNDGIESVRAAFDAAAGLPEAICVGGLRVDPGVQVAWNHVYGHDLDLLPKAGARQKAIPARLLSLIDDELARRGLDTPIFQHSSEAISSLIDVPEFNLYRYRSGMGDLVTVPEIVLQEVRSRTGKPVVQHFQEAAKRLGVGEVEFSVVGGRVLAGRELLPVERTALIHAVGHSNVLP